MQVLRQLIKFKLFHFDVMVLFTWETVIYDDNFHYLLGLLKLLSFDLSANAWIKNLMFNRSLLVRFECNKIIIAINWGDGWFHRGLP